jgi:hypothetical protein
MEPCGGERLKGKIERLVKQSERTQSLNFTLPAGLARLIRKPVLFSLTNGWAKSYQVDSHRKAGEMQGEF